MLLSNTVQNTSLVLDFLMCCIMANLCNNGNLSNFIEIVAPFFFGTGTLVIYCWSYVIVSMDRRNHMNVVILWFLVMFLFD